MNRPTRITFVGFATVLSLATAASLARAETTIVCTGSVTTYDPSGSGNISGGAIVDLEKSTFKTSFLGVFNVISASATLVTFKNTDLTNSGFGTLDRVSGQLNINYMKPVDRAKLASGGTVKFTMVVQAICTPRALLF